MDFFYINLTLFNIIINKKFIFKLFLLFIYIKLN